MRLVALFLMLIMGPLACAEWSVPVGGNAYRTAPDPRGPGLRRDETLRWEALDSRFSIFFRVDRPAELALALDATGGESTARVAVESADESVEVTFDPGDFKRHPLGIIKVPRPGYVELSLQGVEKTGGDFGRIRSLMVDSDTPDLRLDYVRSAEGNMFYWGRRGPSVHLRYRQPEGKDIEYAYSEVTVPEGSDAIGSFFMANGFGEGYFGMQVKGENERWILFSVWSPHRTDDPREVPEDERVATLARGKDVTARDFGHEGSGAQSFLSFPWKAGVTYRFLTRVRPDGAGRTVYTGWFGEKRGEWRLIASFRRPKTDTWLRGFHSFLENFAPTHGHLERKAFHGHQWVCDREGHWHELTQATFTADATAPGGHRLDYAGGIEDGRFFLRNCGFFDDPVRIGSVFDREPRPTGRPAIAFDRLPME